MLNFSKRLQRLTCARVNSDYVIPVGQALQDPANNGGELQLEHGRLDALVTAAHRHPENIERRAEELGPVVADHLGVVALDRLEHGLAQRTPDARLHRLVDMVGLEQRRNGLLARQTLQEDRRRREALEVGVRQRGRHRVQVKEGAQRRGQVLVDVSRLAQRKVL